MELKDFLKEYLPDYERKFSAGQIYKYAKRKITIYDMQLKYFSEAFSAYEAKQAEKLQVIIERACELQRESCAKTAMNAHLASGHNGVTMEEILNAEMPSMEDLLNETESS